jgi:isopentenyl phosphate kinase
MHGEVLSHFSTLKASGETIAKGDFRELEHGDEVFIAAKVKVDKLTFPQDKDGMITRQQSAKASEEMYIITAEEFDRATVKYKEEETGQLSITGEMERNGDFDADS